MGVAAEAQAEEEPPAPPEHSTGEGVVFLTVTEVATVMRASRMTVYRLVHSGALPAIRVGRSFRMSEQAVHDYMEASFKGSLRRLSSLVMMAMPGIAREEGPFPVGTRGRPGAVLRTCPCLGGTAEIQEDKRVSELERLRTPPARTTGTASARATKQVEERRSPARNPALNRPTTALR